MDSTEFMYKNGFWTWDDDYNDLTFNSYDAPKQTTIREPTTPKKHQGKDTFPTSIKFKDVIDNVHKIQFRRLYQRRLKPDEPDYITIQDIKDVALFIANTHDLSVEFIRFFHTPEMDRFLRAMIIYMQFFCQVFENMNQRREEARRKLRQPIVTALENIVRDDLADLRCMVAREYSVLLLGVGKSRKFHHLISSTNSLSERDRRLYEALICMTVRVIWIALQRKHLNLIDMEVNRMFRTDSFNVIAHRGRSFKSLTRTQEEERILKGVTGFKEIKLSQRSSLIKELVHGKHDYRMLTSGFKDAKPKDERMNLLENLYAAPEDFLYQNKIPAGLLGVPRSEVDSLMYQRERTSKTYDKAPLEIPVFKPMPKYEEVNVQDMPNQFPTVPCKYQESLATKRARQAQCKMWIEKIKNPLKKTSVVGSMLIFKVDE